MPAQRQRLRAPVIDDLGEPLRPPAFGIVKRQYGQLMCALDADAALAVGACWALEQLARRRVVQEHQVSIGAMKRMRPSALAGPLACTTR